MWFRTHPYIPDDRLVSYLHFQINIPKENDNSQRRTKIYLFILHMLIVRIIHDIFFLNTADERHAT